MTDLKKLFTDPPTRYRGAPFWSWNDKLQVPELVRQVDDMKSHGMGGFFMHSRDGLETEYMGAEWMHAVVETVQAAKRAGSYAWLYDEDRWPSGAAGGLVPARGGDAYRAKGVVMWTCQDFTPHPSVLAVFRAIVDGNQLLKATRLSPDAEAQAAEGEDLLVFERAIAQPSEWFNNDSPADNLNPDSVAAFIDITYEAYFDAVGDEFGTVIPGIFTDEPNFGTDQVAGADLCLPWTDTLGEIFETRRGYSVLDVLPYIFLIGEHTVKARHDFWWTISEQFTDAYSKQIGAWCDAHHLAYTGHFLLENEFGDGIVSAGALMPHYVYQAVPGIDMLTIQTNEDLTVKQCSSVANQFGREFMLSELYGCAGWEMTFEDQKWSGDWQYVLGVSLRCQHLALYSLRGCRKRDYPPSFNYNTTWWKYNKVVEDYFARVGLLTTQGKALRDVLVLHPIATAWSMVGNGKRSVPGLEQANAYGGQVNDFTRALLATHYEFDFGDEQIMAQYARIEDDALWVNQAPYQAVIVPPGMQTLFASTLAVLERFVEAGGVVIAFHPVPHMVEAVQDGRAAAFFARPDVIVLEDVSQLQHTLEETVPRRVSLTDRHGQEVPSLVMMERESEDKIILFVVNLDRHNSHHVRVMIEGLGHVQAWDALTGTITTIPVNVTRGAVWFETDFSPSGSALYVLHKASDPERTTASVQMPKPSLDQYPCRGFIGPVCEFRRTDPNVLTLDQCRYRFEDGEWSASMVLWQAQREVRDTLGMRNVYYNGLPQRYKWVNAPHARDGTPVSFQFAFHVRDVPETPVFLLIEGAKDFTINLNDQVVDNEPAGWYLDRSFHKVVLPALREGTNILTLSCAYENRMEVEDCFILGDFGVTPERDIVNEPRKLHFGDWSTQGYFHYPGSIIYQSSFTYDPEADGRIGLVLGDHRAITVAVHVNQEVAAHIPWADANGLDLTPYLKPGTNAIGIEVVGSPRNMLGPLHRRRGYEKGTSWRSFRMEGVEHTDDYVVWPFGLFEQVRLVSLDG